MAEEGSKRLHGWAIRAIREALNLSQADAAAEAEISAPYLSQIESGVRRTVSEVTFIALVKTLRIRDPRAILASPCDRCIEAAALMAEDVA